MMFKSTLFVAALAVSVFSQNVTTSGNDTTSAIPTISTACLTAIAGISASPDAACLAPGTLVSAFLTLTTNTTESLITPINTWLNSLCGLGSCSNATLASIITNVTTGCSTDLSSFGYDTSDTTSIIQDVQSWYPTVRGIVCLKDNSGGSLCVTEALTTLQSVVGPLTIDNLHSVEVAVAAMSLPTNLTCTDCVKAAYNLINQNMGPDYSNLIAEPIQSNCPGITNGANPTDIVEIASGAPTASSSDSSKKSAAIALNKGTFAGIASVALVVVASAVILLA